ncbi:hypothetical protein [Pontivivens insulae]|uniref:Uncharacterized protein n=1 Tax=Pontivivens insulae TaxID=1639689 RepID=A0A2R8ADB1_9RHOB|nr:hypothetical protein [Pontivivens insulae]RED14150.1 hypothetical protein DFR53_1505 [Pontivivens insulae]SPF30226.1 hypothetical protein POI8812_02561 [Pontivivens insulae]
MHRPFLTALAALLIFAGPIQAHVIGGAIVRQSGNGSFQILDTSQPFSVGQDTFNTDHLYAFDEDQDIVLVEPVRVDIGIGQNFIRAGTRVASHYVFFDSLSGVHIGYVDFDATILGIAAQQDTMAATDYLSNNAVDYISTHMRGLEAGDQVWIDPEDPRRLWVYWAGSSPGDYIRVFTSAGEADMLM